MNDTTPFWSNKPTILLDKDLIFQIWPTNEMNYETKLNAITRIVILLSMVGFLFTGSFKFIVIGILTLSIIISLYQVRKSKIIDLVIESNSQNNELTEGFECLKKQSNKSNKTTTNPITLETQLLDDFKTINKTNPFGNVLLTDIMDEPNRKPAPPSFNHDIHNEINLAVKKQTQMLNPEIKNTDKQLYGNPKDNYDFDNSMMRFYTRVDNDQDSFAQYLYGDMHSSKENTPEGTLLRSKNNYRHVL